MGILDTCARLERLATQGPRLTSKEWQRILPNAVVVDPDGWDRQNFDYAWNVERITKREYKIRLGQSTCRWFLS